MSKNGQHWSREFEEAVLGAVLYDEKALEEIPFLKPEHFYNTSNSLIYKQMMKLKNAGEKIDTITVHDSLKELGLLDETGGGYFLTGLFDTCFTLANVEAYAEKIYNYAQRRELLKLGYRLYNGDVEVKTTALQQLKEFDLVPPWQKEDQSIKFYSFEDLINDESTSPPQLIGKGLLPAQSILLLSGAPKTGKSILAINLGICLAVGQDWFQFRIQKPVKVTIFQTEVVYWALKDRIQKMENGCNLVISEDSIFLSEPFQCDIRSDKGYKLITESISKYQPTVVIIDPLISFHTEDENDNVGMQRVMAQFRELTFLGVSVIIVHHSRKTSDNATIANPRGASAIAGAVDSVLELSKNEGIICARFDLRYDETPDEMLFKRDPETLWLMRYNPELEAKHNNAIIKHLTDTGSEGVPMIYLVNELLKEFDKSDRTIRRYISDLSKTGIITVQGKGNSKRVFLSCNLD